MGTPHAASQERSPGLLAETTQLIGRTRELAEVVALLQAPGTRLLTLTGAGGTGKTRLARALAAHLADVYPDGIVFVDLATISEPRLVGASIARALGLKDRVGTSPSGALVRHLRGRDLLLMLDNFEQVLPAAPLAARLLEQCPRLRIVVTSRAALRLSAEHEYPVPPLAVPDLRRPLPALEVLTAYEAVALFTQRARAVRPDFEVTAANAPAVAEVCARLDGLPLAIELAAARTNVLSPQALLARLGDRLALLTGGGRDLPARQQTLRNTLDWSYGLLTPNQQRLFAQLAVFTGGCGLDAIQAVCRLDTDVPVDPLDELAALVDHSLLVRQDATADEPRFGMLETLRAYAREQLGRSAEAPELRRRHAVYYLCVAKRAEPELTGPHQVAWLARLERDHDNVRAALQWSLATESGETAVQLGAALYWFWLVHGHLSEGRRWLETALGAAGERVPLADRAGAFHAAGVLAWNQGDLPAASAHLERALALRRELGDAHAVTRTLANLAIVTHMRLGAREALPRYEETLALFQQLGDQHGVANTLNNMALAARDAHDYRHAESYLERCLALRRTIGDAQGTARALANLGIVRGQQGQPEAAAACLRESLHLAREIGVKDVIAYGLEGVAELARAGARPAQAARLLGAAEALREAIGSPRQTVSDRADYARTYSATRLAVGADAFDVARTRGRDLALEDAIQEALAEAAGAGRATPESTTRPRANALTRREREVAVLVARGLTNAQIAEALVITEGTAALHVAHILAKLGFRTRAQIASWATQHGLVSIEPHPKPI